MTTYNIPISNCIRVWDPPTSRLHDVQSRQQKGPFKSRLATALFRAPTTWTCYLGNQRGALSHAQRAGSVYKAAVWSTRDSVLDASLSYGYNGISIDSKLSTDRPGSDPAGRPLIHPRNQHDPTGSDGGQHAKTDISGKVKSIMSISGKLSNHMHS
jgi:hypothetical protein